jgi:hypothetical protein
LQRKNAITKENLNQLDFVSVWRSLETKVDHLLFNGLFMSIMKFHDVGIEMFKMLFGYAIAAAAERKAV